MALFIIVLELEGEDEPTRKIDYESIKECLNDNGLKALFDNGLVISVQIQSGGQRITALPKAIASWERFKDQVISNSTTIFRRP